MVKYDPNRTNVGNDSYLPPWLEKGALETYRDVLKVRKHAPSSFTSYPVTTIEHIDASTNELYIEFVAPATGNVLVSFSGWGGAASGTQMSINLRTTAGDVAGSAQRVSTTGKIFVEWYITDLIPGNTYKYKIGIARLSGTGTASLDTSTTLGPMVIKAVVAPK